MTSGPGFNVGITLHLVDKVSGALAHVSKQFTQSATAAAALQTKINAIHSSFNSGMVMIGGGMALAAPLMVAAKKAESLEFALNRVQTATGASNREMQDFSRHLSKVSNMVGVMSKPTLANFAYNMHESGIHSLKDIDANIELYAKGADVLSVLSKNRMSPEHTAHAFSALAHHYGFYTADKMRPVIDAAVALAPSTPSGVSTFQRMGANIDVLGKRVLGMDPRELLALETTIAQTTGSGGAGKGALSSTNVINALKRTMPGVIGSGLLHGSSAFSAAVMGLANKKGYSTVMKNGHLDLAAVSMRMFEITQGAQSAIGRVAIAKEMLKNVSKLPKGQAKDTLDFASNVVRDGGRGTSAAQLLTKLFQQQAGTGGTMLNLFGDKGFMDLYNKNKQIAYNSAGATDRMQEKISQSTHFQNMRAATNVETLMSTFGMVMLPTLKKIAIFIGDTANKLNTFAETHPRAIKAIVGLISVGSALLILGGAVNIVKAGILGLQVLWLPFAASLRMAGLVVVRLAANVMFLRTPLMIAFGVVSKFWLPLAIITTVITGLILVITNWKTIMAFAKSGLDMVVGAFRNLVAMLPAVAMQLGAFLSKIPFLGDAGKAMQAAGTAGQLAMAGAGLVGAAQQGANPASVKNVKGGNTTINAPITNVAGAGHHSDQCAAGTVKKIASAMNHKAGASSGGSVGRSKHQHGNHGA